MSQGFDPYHKWLGIPPNECPPNHYRLLGISLFESDSEVIENAVKQRLAHLQSFATGTHAALAERLMNEIAASGVHLLMPTEKRAYDATLRAAMEAGGKDEKTQSATPPHPILSGEQELPPPTGADVSQQLDQFDFLPSVAEELARMERRKPKPSAMRIVRRIVGIILSGAVGLAIACFILYLISPKHPFIEMVDTAKQQAENPPPQSTSLPPPTREDHELDSTPVPPPKTKVREPELLPLPPGGALKKNERLPPDAGPPAGPPSLKAPPRETRIEIVLDLTKKVAYTTIPAAANGEKVGLKVEDVTGLDTPYEIKPSHGVIQAGQPVDIVLKDYPDIKLHLSLAKDGTVVEVAPKIDIGQGKTTAFTKKWCKQSAA